MITNLENRAITSRPLFLNRWQLADKCNTSVGRIERLMARGRLVADASDGKDSPLFSADRLTEIQQLLFAK
jgi:hypothetical protein